MVFVIKSTKASTNSRSNVNFFMCWGLLISLIIIEYASDISFKHMGKIT